MYHATAVTTDGRTFTKEGNMSEITTWILGFIMTDIQSVVIGRIVAKATGNTITYISLMA